MHDEALAQTGGRESDAGAREGRAAGSFGIPSRFAERWRRLSLLRKTMILNSAVVLLGAIAGTYLTRALAGGYSGLTLALAFFTCGALTTILVNYVAFWDHFRPLMELSRALEAIRDGQEARSAIAGMRGAGWVDIVASASTLLDHMEDESLQFSARLLGSIEAERQRIGRELHDNAGQILAAAMLKLEFFERQLAAGVTPRPSMAPVRLLLEQALNQLRVAIYDLRPTMLDDLGLAAALRWYVTARTERPGLEVVMRLDDGARRLPPIIEIAIYRVGQEALANVVKHAAASRVEIGLEIKPGFAVLTILDNGKGFDLTEARGRGLGLRSMRERVAQLGGQFNIVTGPGEGTRVYAVIALPVAEPDRETA